jgi:hypothetical protein
MNQLLRWYPDKQRVPVVIPARDFRLRFEDQLAYSWLVYRARKGRGASRAGLARATGLARRSMPAIVKRLVGAPLIEVRNRLLFALQPTPDQFTFTQRDAEWPERLAYWWFLVPSAACPLTLRQVAVLCDLHTLSSSGRKRLARILRFDRSTVRTALAKLRDLLIVNELDEPLKPTPAHLAWWQDRPKLCGRRLPPDWPNLAKYLKGLPEHLEKCYPDDHWVFYFGEARFAAETAGYDFGKFVGLLLDTAVALKSNFAISEFVRKLPGLIRRAEQETRKHNSSHAEKYPNGFGLLRYFCKIETSKKGKARPA